TCGSSLHTKRPNSRRPQADCQSDFYDHAKASKPLSQSPTSQNAPSFEEQFPLPSASAAGGQRSRFVENIRVSQRNQIRVQPSSTERRKLANNPDAGASGHSRNPQ